ncbi:MAG: hypothetical protein ACYTGC_12125, partial [Planctomycetota bacterium]
MIWRQVPDRPARSLRTKEPITMTPLLEQCSPRVVTGALLCLVLTLLPSHALGQGTLIYDLDFNPLTHTAGQPPTLGGPPDRVSTIFSGNPIVVSSFGPLDDQPLRLEQFAQIRLFDVIGFEMYTVEFEFVVPSGGGLVVFLDAPSIRRLSFLSSGQVFSAVADNTCAPQCELIRDEFGSFDAGERVAVRITADLPGDIWSIELDGMLAYSGPFGIATILSSVRFVGVGRQGAAI